MGRRLSNLWWNGIEDRLPQNGYHSPGIVIRNETGFTLLEMLAAISIMAVLLGILSQFLYSGVRLWAKNDRAYQRQHQLKLVYQTMNHDFATIFNGNYLPDITISGNENNISFWQASSAGLNLVKYSYDQHTKQVLRSAGFWGSDPEAKVVFKEILSWKFEYYQPRTKNWLMDWKPDPKNEIPALIRITVKTGAGSLGEMVFPVKVWFKEEEPDVQF